MKTCTRCGESKGTSEFNRSARNADGLHSYCRDCSKAHYRLNASRHALNVKAVRVRRKSEARVLIAPILAEGCVDCGMKDIRALEFDHVRGEKVAGIGTLIRDGHGTAAILAEIAKCDVRCRNCHAIATMERLGLSWHGQFID